MATQDHFAIMNLISLLQKLGVPRPYVNYIVKDNERMYRFTVGHTTVYAHYEEDNVHIKLWSGRPWEV